MSNDLAVLERQMQPLMPRFADVLPAGLPVDRLMRTIMVSCERMPMLLGCDRQSLFNAAMSAACLGLEVDGVTGQAYFIPFKNKVQLIVGYRGMNTLAARSGITIAGAVVCEGDDFAFEKGSSPFVKHVAKLGKRGRIIGAWATATSNNRPPVIEVMGIDELMAVKNKSPGAKRSDSPWNDPNIGFPAMCEKTVKRRLARSLPLNVMQLAARLDEAFDEQGKHAHITPERGIIIDGEFSEPSPTPTASQLLDRSPRPSSRTDSAADQPAPSMPSDGAGEVPTWQDYSVRWDTLIANATKPAELKHWNDEKPTRNEITWPSDAERKALEQRVRKAVEFLSAQ